MTVQERLAALWSEKLGTPVGPHDDFFELGGHSLMAADLQLDIYDSFGVEVPAYTLFLRPTVAQLAAALEEEMAGAAAG